MSGFRWRLPRRTVRLRLTLLYGSLFLASGVALLILTNVLVRQATSEVILFRGDPDGLSPATRVALQLEGFADLIDGVDGSDASRSEDVTTPRRIPADAVDLDGTEPTSRAAVVRLLEEQAAEFRAAAQTQRDAERRQLLVQSGVALGVMSFVSIGLGWLVAGRVLSPLRTITAAARDISATNLHQRLALAGPDDELKELGDTFDGLLERLERAFEAQRQFVANASHELRTPLARQRTLIEVALDDPDAPAESLRETHRRVLASGEEQERLINGLLALARSEHGLVQRVTIDLAPVVRSVIEQLESDIAAGGGIRVEAQLASAHIAGDRDLIERLAMNLIDNALRYNVPGGWIRVLTEMPAGRPRLVVSNTGPAISRDDVERLLQPFRRLGQDRVRQHDGHGLGLSIVAAIARAHDATLDVSPQPEGGLHTEVGFPPPMT